MESRKSMHFTNKFKKKMLSAPRSVGGLIRL